VSQLVPWFRRLPVFTQDAAVAFTTWALGLVLYASGLYPLAIESVGTPMWVRLLLLTVISVIQLFRRRIPFALIAGTVVVGVDVSLGPTVPMLLVYTDLLYAATLYGSRQTHRAMIGLAGAGTLALIVGAAVLSSDWRNALIAAFAGVPFLVVPVWWATNIRQQRDIADNERANTAQLAKISELDRHAAVSAERSRMARDLHDVIAGHLSAIAIQSEAILTMADADPATSREVLRSVRENSVSALEEMRAMIGLLRSDGSEDETVSPARLAQLSKLVESARISGMEVEVRLALDETRTLPAAVDLTAYRIAQEALTNAVKHAPGTRATVDIRYADGILTVEVTNELTKPAARPRPDNGMGLLNMRERANALGGSLSAGPSEGAWRVHAVLPFGGTEA
jgi:signal transduction histidine kinase